MELPNRDALERDFTGTLARLGTKHRRELLTLIGDPPDVDNVPSEFWSRVESDMQDELAALLLLLFITSAEFHGGDAAAAAARGATFAGTRSAMLSSDFVTHSQEMLAGYGTAWDVSPTTADVAGNVESIFGRVRSEMIAVTETTLAQSQGAEWAIGATVGLSDEDEWQTEGDSSVCAICKPLDGMPRVVWSREFPAGPPSHVNCRCEIIYANAMAFT